MSSPLRSLLFTTLQSTPRTHGMIKHIFSVVIVLWLACTAHAYEMSDSDKDRYLTWIESLKTGEAALAIAKDFAWAAGWGKQEREAKYDAMTKCREYSKKPTTCRVMDVGGASEFINRRN